MIRTIEYIAPLNWATALINDDWSGLDDDEAERVEAFVSTLPGPVVGLPVDEGFMPARWTDTPGELAQDFATYAVQELD